MRMTEQRHFPGNVYALNIITPVTTIERPVTFGTTIELQRKCSIYGSQLHPRSLFLSSTSPCDREVRDILLTTDEGTCDVRDSIFGLRRED